MAQTVTSNRGTLELNKNWMVEVHGPHEYFRRMKRLVVARIFRQKGAHVMTPFESKISGDKGWNDFLTDSILTPDELEIGCTNFSGENITKIRKWALAKNLAKKN